MTRRVEPAIVQNLRPSAGRLTDKTIVVTGGTSGIGKATAILCAHEGANVVFAGRRAEKGAVVTDEIASLGGSAVFVQADVTVEEDLRRIVDTAVERFSRIDGLFNNAGCLITKPTVEFTREDWERFTDLDAYSYLRMMQLVLPIMEQQGGGSIVNCTSLAALDNNIPGGALYCFVKAGVNHMTHCIAAEYAGKGIRVNNVLPGLIATEMVLSGPGADGFEMMQETMPAGRAGSPLEVAYAVVHLLSDESSYTSGSSLLIDHGARGN